MPQTISLTAPHAPAVAADHSAAVRTDTVHVVFTTPRETLAAMRVAAALGHSLKVPLTLVHFRTVPYPLTVKQPAGISPVETEAFVAALRREGIDVRVRVCLCRDERRTRPTFFKPRSLIVVGGRRQWWRFTAERIRRQLEAAGHYVLTVAPPGRSEEGGPDA
jgi:hypothetical protein